MAPGGVLVLSFPCLNSEDSPDQLRFEQTHTRPRFWVFQGNQHLLQPSSAVDKFNSFTSWYAVDSFCFANSLIDSFGSFYLQSVKD